MIKRLQIKNFKSLADVDIHFTPITVLLGLNGAGKSNILDAIRFMRDALRFDLVPAAENVDGTTFIRRQEKDKFHKIALEIEIETKNIQGSYRFIVETVERGSFYQAAEEQGEFYLKPPN